MDLEVPYRFENVSHHIPSIGLGMKTATISFTIQAAMNMIYLNYSAQTSLFYYILHAIIIIEYCINIHNPTRTRTCTTLLRYCYTTFSSLSSSFHVIKPISSIVRSIVFLNHLTYGGHPRCKYVSVRSVFRCQSALTRCFSILVFPFPLCFSLQLYPFRSLVRHLHVSQGYMRDISPG